MRYQESGLAVRCWRWWRYMPLAYAGLLVQYVAWLCHGLPRYEHEFSPEDIEEYGLPTHMTRRETAMLLFDCAVGRAQARMGWYYTLEECFKP